MNPFCFCNIRIERTNWKVVKSNIKLGNGLIGDHWLELPCSLSLRSLISTSYSSSSSTPSSTKTNKGKTTKGKTTTRNRSFPKGKINIWKPPPPTDRKQVPLLIAWGNEREWNFCTILYNSCFSAISAIYLRAMSKENKTRVLTFDLINLAGCYGVSCRHLCSNFSFYIFNSTEYIIQVLLHLLNRLCVLLKIILSFLQPRGG